MFTKPNKRQWTNTFPAHMTAWTNVIVSFCLISCGGAGSNLGNVSTNLSGDLSGVGIFRDSNVAGLSYETPTKIGVTGTDGQFEFQVNESVTFSIGGVTLGTTRARQVITPVDLASSISTNAIEAKNISRFLQMLDEDGDPDNGILISQAIQDIAVNWSQVDFSTDDLDSALVAIMSDVNSVDSPPTHTLPDETTAKNHLDNTLLCTYSGAFQGQVAGDDGGHFGLVIEPTGPRAGLLNGFLFSTTSQSLLDINGQNPIIFDDLATFAQPNATTPSERSINMRFTSLNQFNGNWSDSQGAAFGTLAGDRIAEGQDAVWHFSGKYEGTNEGDDAGVIAFSLTGPNADSINGEIFSMLSGGSRQTLNGLHTNASDIDGSSADGKRWTGFAILDPATAAFGLMSGTWTDDSTGQNGTFLGAGCIRN